MDALELINQIRNDGCKIVVKDTFLDISPAEKLKPELPGILAWAVMGCRLWQTEGLKAPKAVAAATQEYRKESNVIATFIQERCQIGRHSEISKAELYDAYSKWCEESDEDADFCRRCGGELDDV